MKKSIFAGAAIGVMLCLSAQSENPHKLIVDMGHDLVKYQLSEHNIKPSLDQDQTQSFQQAIDKLRTQGGGYLIVPPGTYRVNKLTIPPKVELIGSGRGKTIFRSSGAQDVFLMNGGGIRNFTIYGTPTAEKSGDNWYIGTGGIGKRGTARALTLVAVRKPLGPVVIDNIEALEARYDCLYVRDCDGLTVTNCHFDRAGRNIFSVVGNSDNFIFSGCYFGSYWGLYHSDIEPNKNQWARNGLIVNCIFDGSKAGLKKGTGTWGKMFTFSGMGDEKTRNIAIVDNLFKKIAVRIRGSFPRVQFLYNDFQLQGLKTAILQVRTNKGAALPDCRIIGNKFQDIAPKMIIYNVSVTGEPIIQNNSPQPIYKIGVKPQDSSWQEDHPSVLKGNKKINCQKLKDGTILVKMPLMGSEFNFAKNQVAPRNTHNDLALHSDPLMTLGKAQMAQISSFSNPQIKNANWTQEHWNAKPHDILAIRANNGKVYVMEIIGLQQNSISFRYRLLK